MLLMVGLMIVLLLLALGIFAWKLWRRVSVVLALCVAHQTTPVPIDPLQVGRINEDPLPAGQAAHEFWLALHRTPVWKTLSHIYQADVRNYLRDAKDAAMAGNQAGALFSLGKAHEAAFNAVKPETQVQRIVRSMVAAQNAEADDTRRDGARPADRWGENFADTKR